MSRALLLLLSFGCTSGPIVYTGEARRFVIDAIELPRTNNEAREYGLDLNDDLTADNQLGMVVSTLASQGDATPNAPDMIAANVLASSFEIQADDFKNDSTVSIRYFGADAAPNELIGGELSDGVFTTTAFGSASAHVPIFLHADPSIVPLLRARIELTTDGNGGFDGKIAGGVPQPVALTEAVAGITQMVAARPSEHHGMFLLFDTNKDFELSEQELNESSWIQSLLSADIELEGYDVVSLGFRVHISPCAEGRCSTAPPANPCFDRVRDGDESDIDCGGSCGGCTEGRACTLAADCESGACDVGACRAPTCTDGMLDGAETDVDCGGPCGDCATGQRCWYNGDCASGQCGPTSGGTVYEKCE